MPLENSALQGKSSSKNVKRISNRLSSLVEDSGQPDDAPYRVRLHHLFSQIEKEFELLYIENINCKYTYLPTSFS